MVETLFGRPKLRIKQPSSKITDMLGRRFGRLVVVALATSTKSGAARWICRCDCDGRARTIVRGDSLRQGATQSCGCMSREATLLRALERPKAGPKPRKPRPKRKPPQKPLEGDLRSRLDAIAADIKRRAAELA
jgi:hypothetical protein